MKVAKKLLVGVSLVSAVGLLAACGNSSKSSNGGKTKEIEFFSQKKEMQPTLQKIIKDFEKENPDIKELLLLNNGQDKKCLYQS